MGAGVMSSFTDVLVSGATTVLIPGMVAVFAVAMLARLCIYFLIRGERKFTVEFEARVERYVNNMYEDVSKKISFHQLTKTMLDKSFYEL